MEKKTYYKGPINKCIQCINGNYCQNSAHTNSNRKPNNSSYSGNFKKSPHNSKDFYSSNESFTMRIRPTKCNNYQKVRTKYDNNTRIIIDNSVDLFHDFYKFYVENNIELTINNFKIFGVNRLDKNGMSLLSHISRYAQNNGSSIPLIKELVNSKAKIDIKNNDGWTPLMIASRHTMDGSSLDIVKTLLDLKANPNIKNNNDESCLAIVNTNLSNGSSIDTANLLLKYGAKKDDLNETKNKLCVVCMENKKSCVFVNCGHKCICEICSSKLSQCVICRKPGSAIKIYSS